LNSGKPQHLSEKVQFSCFWILPGSADTLVRRGGNKVLLDSLAYSFDDISAKNYENWLMNVKVIEV